jgi:hypothetical protein
MISQDLGCFAEDVTVMLRNLHCSEVGVLNIVQVKKECRLIFTYEHNCMYE